MYKLQTHLFINTYQTKKLHKTIHIQKFNVKFYTKRTGTQNTTKQKLLKASPSF